MQNRSGGSGGNMTREERARLSAKLRNDVYRLAHRLGWPRVETAAPEEWYIGGEDAWADFTAHAPLSSVAAALVD